jgi:hypothetical protein
MKMEDAKQNATKRSVLDRLKDQATKEDVVLWDNCCRYPDK